MRNKNNEVLDHVTDIYQSVSPNEEQEPPPPVTIEPVYVTSETIGLTWKPPKSDLAIVEYTVTYGLRSAHHQYERTT